MVYNEFSRETSVIGRYCCQKGVGGSGRGRTVGERGQRASERKRERERGIVQTVHSIIYFFVSEERILKYTDKCVTSFPGASAYPSSTTLRCST